MLKRIFPIISCISLVLCLIAMPASAASSYTILNYKDYVYGSTTDVLGKTVEKFKIPKSVSAAQVIDSNGSSYLPTGQFSGRIYGDVSYSSEVSVGAYWPGQVINKTYLNASNIPDGTQVRLDCKFDISDDTQQVFMQLVYRFGVSYFDENFNVIGYQVSPITTVEIRGSGYDDNIYEGSIYKDIVLVKPPDTAYLCYYATFKMFIEQTHDDSFYVDWWIDDPYFESHKYIERPDDALSALGKMDFASWLLSSASAFLDLEIAPGLSLNQMFYVVLVVGIVFWFLRVVS